MSKKKSMYFLLSLFFITVITIWIVKILDGTLPYIDQITRNLVESLQETKLYYVARWITELGSASFLIPFTIIMAIILWIGFRDYLPALVFSGAVLTSHLANILIKTLVARERPSINIGANAEGYSFPSGHAMISIVCYGLLMYILTRKIPSTKVRLLVQTTFSLLIVLIGLSRVIINVHYLTDVLTGFLVGYVFLVIFINLYNFLLKKRYENRL